MHEATGSSAGLRSGGTRGRHHCHAPCVRRALAAVVARGSSRSIPPTCPNSAGSGLGVLRRSSAARGPVSQEGLAFVAWGSDQFWPQRPHTAAAAAQLTRWGPAAPSPQPAPDAAVPTAQALHALHTTTTRRIKLCGDWAQLRRVVDTHGGRFNHINTAAALVQLAQLGPGPAPPQPMSDITRDGGAWGAFAGYESLLQQLLQMTAGAVPDMGARQAANCLWAAGRLSCGRQGGHPMCTALALQIVQQQAAFLLPWSNAQELSMSIWAVASLGIFAPDAWLYGFLNASITAFDAPGASAQDLASTLWALSTMGVAPDDEWTAAFCARAAEREGCMSHRDAAQIMAAAARLRLDLPNAAPGLLASLLRVVVERRDGARGHVTGGGVSHQANGEEQHWDASLAQALWALATWGAPLEPSMAPQILTLLESEIRGIRPQELATCLWALVTLGEPLPPSLASAVYVATLVPSATPAGAVTLGASEAPEAAPATQLVDGFTPHSLAQLLWAVSVADQSHAAASGLVSHPLAPPADWMRAALASVAPQLHSASDQSLAMLLVALARLRDTPPRAWVAAALSRLAALPQPSAQALANCLWAVAKLGYRVNQEGGAALAAQLLSSLIRETGGSGDMDAAAAGDVPGDSDGWLAGGPAHASQEPGRGWGSQELANTLWALASLGQTPSAQLVHALLSRLQSLYGSAAVRSPQPRELANTLWALGRLGVTPTQEWVAAFWRAVTATLPAFSATDVSQVVYGLAKLGVGPDGVPASQHAQRARAADDAALAAVIAAGGGAIVPQGPSRKAVAAPPAWALPVLSRAAATLGQCTPQDLSNLSWGLVQLGVTPGAAWCDAFVSAIVSCRAAMSGAHMAVCVWALGRLGHRPAPRALAALEDALFRRLPALSPRELAACVSGLAAMSYSPQREWLEAFATQCMAMAPQFTQQDWSVVVYALAHIVEVDSGSELFLEDLFLSPQLAACIHDFDARGVATLLYACSVLRVRSRQLIGRLLAAATTRMPDFTGPELSALAMACVRLGAVPDARFFNAWSRRVMDGMEAAAARHEGHARVAQKRMRRAAHGFGAAPTTPGPSAAAAAPSSAPQLSGSVLAVCGWAVWQLGLRPSDAWLDSFLRALRGALAAGDVGHQELVMVLAALGHWQVVVPRDLLLGFKRLAATHKPLLTARERTSVNSSLRSLREARLQGPAMAAQHELPVVAQPELCPA